MGDEYTIAEIVRAIHSVRESQDKMGASVERSQEKMGERFDKFAAYVEANTISTREFELYRDSWNADINDLKAWRASASVRAAAIASPILAGIAILGSFLW